MQDMHSLKHVVYFVSFRALATSLAHSLVDIGEASDKSVETEHCLVAFVVQFFKVSKSLVASSLTGCITIILIHERQSRVPATLGASVHVDMWESAGVDGDAPKNIVHLLVISSAQWTCKGDSMIFKVRFLWDSW